MVNANKLRGKIVERGMSIASISMEIGVNKSTFYRKLSGCCPFTIQDADRLVEILGLNAEEAKAIFLAR